MLSWKDGIEKGDEFFMDAVTLSRKEISAQLSEIVQRQLPSPGKRQVTFNQVELLMFFIGTLQDMFCIVIIWLWYFIR